jgi:hypothetical protein
VSDTIRHGRPGQGQRSFGAVSVVAGDGAVVGSQQREEGADEVRANYTANAKPASCLLFLVSRVDFTVLPLLYLGLLVFQLDRMNIASAITDGFTTDIHVQQATINLGNLIMFAGIVAFEIPCNMAQQKVTPPTRHP